MYLGSALFLVVIGMLPLCVARPWIGIMMWCWLGYMNPHRLTWSWSYTMPYASLVGGATLIGFFLTRDREPLPKTRETFLLIALWVFFLLTTIFAMFPDEAWLYLLRVSKVLLFIFIPLFLLQQRERLRAMFLVVALSIGFYGLKGGIWVLLTGGGNRVLMPDDSMLGGANGAGLAFNVALPMLLYLSYEEKNRWVRYALRVVFCFTILSTLFTYSRGAALGVVAVLLFLAAKAKRLVSAIVAMAVLAFFLYSFAPAKWFERMETITNYEEDNSAMSRLDAWYIAYRLALDNPILGGGFSSVGQTEIIRRYMPDRRFTITAHSIWFSMMGEHGFVGLGLFVGLIVSCMFTARRLRRQYPDTSWVVNYSHMLEVSFVGYAVTGTFLSVQYIDLFYQLIASVILLEAVAAREGRRETVPAIAPRERILPGERLVHVRNRRAR